MKTIKIAGKDYQLKGLTFNDFVKLEEYGLDFGNPDNQKPLSVIRALISVVANCNPIKAGELIEKHIGMGGTIEELMQLNEMIEDSAFMQSLVEKNN